mgnify:CR=1 FL=1
MNSAVSSAFVYILMLAVPCSAQTAPGRSLLDVAAAPAAVASPAPVAPPAPVASAAPVAPSVAAASPAPAASPSVAAPPPRKLGETIRDIGLLINALRFAAHEQARTQPRR